jgi:hypothetical protein
VETDLQSTIRYYVSTKGCQLYKKHRDGRIQQLEAGTWLQTIYNQHRELPWEEYDVDDKYYLEQIYKEILNIQPKKKSQLSLSF